jgi:Pup amidohydrolase
MTRDPKRKFPIIAEPLDALRKISRDLTFKWDVGLKGGANSTALEVQGSYLDAVKQLCDLSHAEKSSVVADWEEALSDLATDPMKCRDRLDWVAKLCLIADFRAAHDIAEDDPWLRSLDLEYHRLDTAEGLYYGLEQSGAMRLSIPDEISAEAMHHPPRTTRASIRGKCVQKFGAAVTSAQWDHIVIESSRGAVKISLLDLFAPEQIARFNAALDAARTPEDLQSLVNGGR